MKHKVPICPLCPALITIFLSICFIFALIWPESEAEAGPPAWVRGEGMHQDYPSSGFITALGISDHKGGRAEKKIQAEDRAREGIAKQVRVEIRSRDRDIQTLKGGEEQSVVSSITETSVDLRLEGIDIPRVYYHKRKGLFYALAVLDRAKCGRIIRAEVARLNHKADLLFTRGRSLTEADKDASLDAFFHAMKATL